MISSLIWTSEKSITFIGIMGAGKSHLGKRLAKQLSLTFTDSDEEIVGASNMPIKDFFELYGEDEFRSLEYRVLKRIYQDPRQIVSTGDGAFIHEESRKLIKEKSVSVWLRADLDLVHARTSRRNHRPQLNTENSKEVLEQLIEEREPIYEQADIIIDSEDVDPQSMINKIISALGAWQVKNNYA